MLGRIFVSAAALSTAAAFAQSVSITRVVPEITYIGDVVEFQVDASISGLPPDATGVIAFASGPFPQASSPEVGAVWRIRPARVTIGAATPQTIQVRVNYSTRVNGMSQNRTITAERPVEVKTFVARLETGNAQPLNSWQSHSFGANEFRFDLASRVSVDIFRPEQRLVVYSGRPENLLDIARRGVAPAGFFAARREGDHLLFGVSTLANVAADLAFLGDYTARVAAEQTQGLPPGIVSRSLVHEGIFQVVPPRTGDRIELDSIEYILEGRDGVPFRDGRWRVGRPLVLNAPPGVRLRLVFNGQFVLQRHAFAKLLTNLAFPGRNVTDRFPPTVRNTNGERSPIEDQNFGGEFHRVDVLLELPSEVADFDIQLGLVYGFPFPPPGTQAAAEPFVSRTFANPAPIHVRWLPPADITIDHIEVVQAVQSETNSVPLIAGKRTVARVFALALGGANGTPDQPGVMCTLRAFRDGNPLPGAATPVAGLPTTIPGESYRRSTTEHAIAFELPPEWIQEGSIELRAELSLSGNLKDAKEDNNDFRLPRVTFIKPPLVNPLPVRWFRACVQPDPSRDTCPDDTRWSASIENLAGLMNRLYPAPEGAISYKRLSSKTKVWKGPLDRTSTEFFAYQRQLRAHVSSLFPNAELGLFTAIFPVGTIVPFGPQDPRNIGGLAPLSDPVNWIVDSDNAQVNEWTLAHESGHSLGLDHPLTADNGGAGGPPGYWQQQPEPRTAAIQETGFDVGKGEAIPSTHYDFMAYRYPEIWVSPFHFDRLQRNSFADDLAGLLSAKPPRMADAVSDIAVLSGTIQRDGASAVFDPAFQAPAQGIVRTRWNPSGAYCFRFFAGTQQLAENCFDVATTNSNGVEFDRYPFSFAAALPAGATRASLFRGATELAALDSQGPAPAVSLANPRTGARWQGPQRIAWTSTGSGRLSHAVYYSPDGGSTWEVLDVDLRQPVLDVHSADLPAGSNVVIRVASSSGLNSAADTSGPITVLPTPRGRLSAARVDFGSVLDGRTADRTLDLVSTGNTMLTVRSARVEGRAFQLIANPLAQIPSDSAARIVLRFDPPFGGAHQGTLILETDDFDTPVLRVALTGVSPGTPPSADFTVSPARLEFGPVAAGQSRDLILNVSNPRPFPVTLDGIAPSRRQYAVTGALFPVAIAAGASRAFTIRFSPDSSGDFPGALAILSAGPAVVVPLTGAGGAGSPTGGPRAEVTPASLAFGSVAVGQSREFSLALRNTGAQPLSVTALSTGSAVFAIATPAAPFTIAAGGQISVTVRFSPAAVGVTESSLRIVSNDPGQPSIQTPLSGTGTATAPPGSGKLEAAPATVDFGQAAIGETRTATVTLRNTGAGPLTIALISTGGAPFAVTAPSLPLIMPAGNAQTFALRMTPLAPGPQAGSLSIRSDDSVNPVLTIALSGIATGTAAGPRIETSPASVNFGTIAPGQTTTQPLLVRNTGTAPLTIGSLSIASDRFVLVGITAPQTIPPQSAAAWSLRFSAAGAGTTTSALVIVSNDQAAPSLSVALTGSASATIPVPKIRFEDTSIDFGSVPVGTTAEYSTVIGNSGNAPLVADSIRLDNARFTTRGSTSFTLEPGNLFDLRIFFTPNSIGEQRGEVRIVSNDSASPHAIKLIGAGR